MSTRGTVLWFMHSTCMGQLDGLFIVVLLVDHATHCLLMDNALIPRPLGSYPHLCTYFPLGFAQSYPQVAVYLFSALTGRLHDIISGSKKQKILVAGRARCALARSL